MLMMINFHWSYIIHLDWGEKMWNLHWHCVQRWIRTDTQELKNPESETCDLAQDQNQCFHFWLSPTYRVTPGATRPDSTPINQHLNKLTWTRAAEERLRGGKDVNSKKVWLHRWLGFILCFMGPTGALETEKATRAAPPTSKRLLRKTMIWHRWSSELNWLWNIRSSEAGRKSPRPQRGAQLLHDTLCGNESSDRRLARVSGQRSARVQWFRSWSKLTVLMRTQSKTSETGRQTGVWNLLMKSSKTV